GGIDGQDVVASEEGEIFGAELLVIVTGNGKWKFGDHGKEAAHAIRAQPIGFDGRAGGYAHTEVLLRFGQRIGQVSFSPKEVRLRVYATVIIAVGIGFGAEFALIPNG